MTSSSVETGAASSCPDHCGCEFSPCTGCFGDPGSFPMMVFLNLMILSGHS